MNMKKILCVILCICMLLTTEMLTFVASAVEFLPTFDFSGIKDAINALADNQVVITVNFLYDESIDTGDKIVEKPYVSRIESGHDFNDNIVPPSTLGYRATKYTLVSGPAQGHSWVDGTLKLDFNNLTENVEINVYYEAIQVNYAVRYFFQNIYDDGYTEETSLYKTAQDITGTELDNDDIKLTVDEAATAGIDLNAFMLLYFVPDKVAADGSTIFECYYDRNYYTINFELDGGYGIEPFYERYGTKIIAPTPKKPGYAFKGWDEITDTYPDGDGTVDYLPSEMGMEDKTYKAIWEVNEDSKVNYTVVYWLDNGLKGTANENRIIYNVSEIANAEDIVSGTNNLALVYDDYEDYMIFVRADTDVHIDGDGSTKVNVYYTCQLYTLRFFYARSSGTGDNIKYEIVGGSTWKFGHISNGTKTTIEGCLENIPDSEWGEVKNLPAILSSYESRNEVTKGSVNYVYSASVTYTYYYFDLTVPFDCDLTELWPVGIFEPIAVDAYHTSADHITDDGYCKYPNAYFSAWNGEYRVNYTHTHSNNPTVKGKYKVFDDQLIYKPGYTEETTAEGIPIVNFMSYWVNGADVNWSVPKQFEYFICTEMLEAPDTSKLSRTNNYSIEEYKDAEDNRYIKKGSVWYFSDKDLRFYVYDDSSVDGQTDIGIEGFEFNGTKEGYLRNEASQYFKELHDIYFYYDRHDTLKLMFHDGQKILTEKTISELHYNSDISNYDFVPDYYDEGEKEVYLFDGWYTNPSYDLAFKFDFSVETMPAENLTLYAKWVPVKHNVHFFATYEDMIAYQNDPTALNPLQSFLDITHYDLMGSVYKDTNGDLLKTPSKSIELADGRIINLDFVGWFYMDGDVKRAFNVDNTQITDDYLFFAVWRSNVPQPYEIKFVTYDKESDQKVEIADPIRDYARLGATITFTAKAGKPYNQLYEGYNSNYFPETQSHSITIAEGQNYYEFVYRNADTPISYIVRVIDENGVELYFEERETSDSVEEVRYIPVSDWDSDNPYKNNHYLPDAFYKKLVISVVWDEDKQEYVGTDANVVTFVYTEVPDAVASYMVRYKMADLDQNYPEGDVYHHTYVEDYVTIPAGEVSVQVEITPPTFSGYVLDEGNYTVLGPDDTVLNKNKYKGGKLTVTEEGVTLVLHYKRRTDLQYTVKYLKYGSNEEIAGTGAETFENLTYGETVEVLPKTITGYNCVTGDATKKSLTITANNEQNVITFLYEPIQYQVQYTAVTFHGSTQQPNGELGGTLSRTQENKAYGVGEFKAVVPTAKQYYQFAGWYTDPECTISANDYGTVSGDSFQPIDAKLKPDEVNTFYAKFERKTGSLTIERNFDGIDQTQVFVYKITNTADANTLYVTASFSNPTVRIEGLLQGEYTIEQVTDWSWRYGSNNTKVVSLNNNEVTITFANTPTNQAWLNSNSQIFKNIFGAVN